MKWPRDGCGQLAAALRFGIGLLFLAASLSGQNLDADAPAATDVRSYIIVAGIHSEEAGEALADVCRGLTEFLEVDLQRLPDVVVLGREQVKRLAAEQNQTDAKLSPGGSMCLVEASIHRTPGGEGYVITGKLHGLNGGKPKQFEWTSSTRELPEIRKGLFEVVTKAVDTSRGNVSKVDARAAAAFFADRRDQFHDRQRFEEAQQMADAALALDPSEERLAKTLRIYTDHVRWFDGRYNSAQALRASQRLYKLRVDWQKNGPEATARGLPVTRSMNPLEPHIRIPVHEEPQDVKRLRAEVDRLRLEEYRLIYEKRRPGPFLLERRLKYATYFATTGREFHETLMGLLADFEQLLARQGIRRSMSERVYAYFIEELEHQITKSRQNCFRSPRHDDQRLWKQEEVVPTWRFLAQHGDTTFRLLGQSGLMALSDDEGLRAAREVCRVLLATPESEQLPARSADTLLYHAHCRLRKNDEFASAFEELLAKAEESGPKILVRYHVTVSYGLSTTRHPDRGVWVTHILRILDGTTLAGREAEQAARLRTHMVRLQEHFGGLTTRPFSTTNGPGPWQDYVARPIKIESRSRDYRQLIEVVFDPRPEAALEDEQLVLVWQHNSDRHLSIERLSLRGGTSRRLGPKIAGIKAPWLGVQVAIAPNAIFIASTTPGIVMLKPDSFQILGQAQGAPGETVQSMAWLDDRLYLTYPNVIARLNIETHEFELLASANALEPRCALDGGDGYQVYQMIADPRRHCLWLKVLSTSDDASRTGIWRLDATSGRFAMVRPGLPGLRLCDDGLLLHDGEEGRWWKMDPETATAELLEGYASWKYRYSGLNQRPRFVKVGEHIIGADGQIFAKDGKEYRLPVSDRWWLLGPAGPGFITHFDNQSNTLWYVAPKQLP